ncbi:GcrA family cell cycle regulator [Kiloniella sp. b19]|uniref:GcrA family cell cycle regulator n=1 Tax=Kiloniella sp. GXU_MW_B19 TaxID=3141326 RepID=UPI0031E06D15
MNWTEERIELLKKLWAEGHSASQIGKELGVSKNAVVGKAHRMKLSARPSPIKRKKAAEDTAALATKDTTAASEKPAEKKAAPKTVSAPKAEAKPAAEKAAASKAKTAPARADAPAAVDAKTAEMQKKAAALKAAAIAAKSQAETSAVAEKKAAATAGRSDAARKTDSKKENQEAIEAADRRLFSGATAAPRKSRGPKCLWPIGDPGDPDFHFCEAPAVHGKPYCAEHCARAYITKTKGEAPEPAEPEPETSESNNEEEAA